MAIDFSSFFTRYEALVQQAENAFNQVKENFPDCVKCEVTCSDCCFALFDLTLVEAIYINHKFKEKYSGKELEALLEKCNETDRILFKIKRRAYKEAEAGKPEADVLTDMAKERVRCPMLNAEQRCDIYPFRPITCRLYGIPTAIGGTGHTCGRSGFEAGKPYPTVHLELIQSRLYEISNDISLAIKSRYSGLADMLVPLSMALLTDFNEEYLGVRKKTEKAE